MAERAHPDDPGFRTGLTWRRRFGIPWPRYRKTNPYLDAFKWRYAWVSERCADREVLDVPCGMGWGTSMVVGTKRLVGMDLSSEAIAEARGRYSGHADFIVGSMESLPFEGSSFDVVSCLEGIEHVPQEVGSRFIDEAWRVLRPQGVLLLSSPYCDNGEHSGNPYHVYEYPPDEIRQLLERRFQITGSVERDVDNLKVLFLEAKRR